MCNDPNPRPGALWAFSFEFSLKALNESIRARFPRPYKYCFVLLLNFVGHHIMSKTIVLFSSPTSVRHHIMSKVVLFSPSTRVGHHRMSKALLRKQIDIEGITECLKHYCESKLISTRNSYMPFSLGWLRTSNWSLWCFCCHYGLIILGTFTIYPNSKKKKT